jgi:AcrR family transcriptional regulator
VDPSRRRARGQRAGLSRERVLDAALALVGDAGPAALTMRRLGAELGVEAMTLYHYVPDKEALLDGIVERLLDEVPPPVGGEGPWQAVLRDYAHALRAVLLRHPGVLPIAAARPAVTRRTLRRVEQALQLLRGAGFALGQALDVFNSLTVFVVGHTAAEAAASRPERAAGPGSATHVAGLDDSEFPLLVTAARTGEGTDDQARFRFAVDALLAGFALALPR